MSDIAGHRFGVVAIHGELAERIREETARLETVACDRNPVRHHGVYSIFVPIVASISVTVLVGWALLIAGIVQLAHGLRRESTWWWGKAGPCSSPCSGCGNEPHGGNESYSERALRAS